jgi:threonine dehydrogenase-like Zn-dependent dehydrogenase
MRAVLWRGLYDIHIAENAPEPEIQHGLNAIICASCPAICGTGLHPYCDDGRRNHGHSPFTR